MDSLQVAGLFVVVFDSLRSMSVSLSNTTAHISEKGRKNIVAAVLVDVEWPWPGSK